MLLGLMVRHRERARSASTGPSARPNVANQPVLPQAHSRSQQHQQKRRFSDNSHAISMLPRSPTDPEEFHNNPEEHELESKRFKPAPAHQPLFIPQKQWEDPIVAQYANADPAEFTAEPYSPTQEEIEAPYDPADVMDVIGEVSKVKGLRSSDESGIDESMQNPSVLTSLLQEGGQKLSASEIADAASDVTANLLTAFSSKPDLTEQQQLLIKLTQQVEDAKKALLDRQIASLQSEIEKATSDSDFSPGHAAMPQPRQPVAAIGAGQHETLEGVTDDQLGSPQIRRAPADSSTAVVEVGDDQGGATPTKDEQESKTVKSQPAISDRSALDFIQSALFDSKAIPPSDPNTTASVPPPISRTTAIPSTEPAPPFQGAYEPEYTPPSTAPAYNPTYNYNHYTPTQPTSQVEEYQPTEQPDWTVNRDYGHGKPGYDNGNEPYAPQEYNPGHHEPQFQQYNNPQGYGNYNRGNEPASGGEGQGFNNWGQRYEGRDPRGHRNDRRGPNKDQNWRGQNRDFNRY